MFEDYMNKEENFGFHSEYYINSKWRKEYGTRGGNEKNSGKGYMKFSFYKNDIYLLVEDEQVILCINPEKRITNVILYLDSDKKVKYSYIAVNKHGYFLYNTNQVTLFDFNGREIYSYKYGSKANENHQECIYIYDSKFYYSITTMKSSIMCIDMITREVMTIWETQKADENFDYNIKEEYTNETGYQYPFKGLITNMGNIVCCLLYVNEERIIAGYIRSRGADSLSYIVSINLQNYIHKIIESKFDKAYNIDLSLKRDNQQIFSFDMLKDIMWVGYEKNDKMNLYLEEIKSLSEIRKEHKIEHYIDTLHNYDDNFGFYYFDGKYLLRPDMFTLYNIKNGKKIEINYHNYQTREVYVFGKFYYIPEWDKYNYCFNSISGNDSYTLEDVRQFIEDAKLFKKSQNRNILQQVPIQTNMGASDYQNFIEQIDNLDDKLQVDYYVLANEIITKSGIVFQDKQYVLDKIVNYLKTNRKEDKPHSEDSKITLSDFRAKAPFNIGFRDELLIYRKSLFNCWDYNAYVGILLGVAGPKHGDSACMNFAIGQGDNGNNTKKTLENRGLISIFEKYKKKKEDTFVMLSDVENEIVDIVPEYAEIRHKFHEIIGF